VTSVLCPTRFSYILRARAYWVGSGRRAGRHSSPSPFPGPRTLRALTTRIAPWLFVRAVKRSKEAGESLRFVEQAELPEDMAWAKGSPLVASAFAGFMAAIEDEARDALGAGARAVIEARVEGWAGEDQGPSRRTARWRVVRSRI
jgi:hypothetical protein